MSGLQRYDAASLRDLLDRVAGGRITVEEALGALRALPFAALGDAHVDHHRTMRTGLPEVVFGPGKSQEQIERIMRELHARTGFALATRVEPRAGAALAARLPDGAYDSVGRVLRSGILEPSALEPSGAGVAVVAAGTSDAPVAAEAAATLEALGHAVARENDVGVAGLHRLLPALERLDACAAVIVVAGMEGALPSVVGGLVRAPVIAVPTSIGYGASFAGLSALLAMLNSCAPGISVVNIDNGFGAACVAHKIVSRTA
jgi:pyridinium-3,5-biscarboxylic acid mononucleotide synthase